MAPGVVIVMVLPVMTIFWQRDKSHVFGGLVTYARGRVYIGLQGLQILAFFSRHQFRIQPSIATLIHHCALFALCGPLLLRKLTRN